MKIKDGIYYVGLQDMAIRNFDGVLNIENGTSYNSYILIGNKKSALIDLAPKEYAEKLISNIEKIIELKKIDYIVLNNTEPAHSGALPLILEKTEAKVIISKHAFMMLKEIMHKNIDPILIPDKGDSISLGNKTLEFIYAPYVYWPDTMFTYVKEDRTIFTGNFLGSHFSSDKIFNDELEFKKEFIEYYKTFMRPFKDYVLDAINKIEKKEIDIIAPAHGPILRKEPMKYLEIYRDLSLAKKREKKKAIIFFATSYGGTRQIAEKIGEGLVENNVEVELFDLNKIQINDEIIDKIEESDALIVGSNTVNGDAMKNVWFLLASLSTINLRNKIGFAFGTYAWSGEAARLIENRMRDLRLKVPEEHFRALMIPTDDDYYEAKEVGKRLADVLNYRVI